MLRTLLLLVAASGCVDPAISPDGVSCEQRFWPKQHGPGPELDLVIAISDAATMAPYRERLLENLAGFGTLIADGGFDVQLIVVGPDSVATAHDYDLPWWSCTEGTCAQRDYEGDLGMWLAALAPAAEAVAPPPLIARVTDALEAVGRPGAALGVALIGVDDDASPAPVEDYAARLRLGRPLVRISTVNGPGATRFGELRDAADEALAVPIGDEEWATAVWFSQFRVTADLRCLEDSVVDLDPDAPGIQPDCVGTDDRALLPPCRMAAPDLPAPDVLPCWWVEHLPEVCSTVWIERLRWEWPDDRRDPELRCACEE